MHDQRIKVSSPVLRKYIIKEACETVFRRGALQYKSAEAGRRVVRGDDVNRGYYRRSRNSSAGR